MNKIIMTNKEAIDRAIERVAYKINDVCNHCYENEEECNNCSERDFYNLLINTLETLDRVKDLIAAQEVSCVGMDCDEFSELEAYYAIKEILRDE